MFLYWAKVVALFSVVAFFSFSCYLEWTLANDSKQITKQSISTLSSVDDTMALADIEIESSAQEVYSIAQNINKTLYTVNKNCDTAPCGTLADVARTLNTVRGTFGQIEVAAIHENNNLTTLDSQEAQLFTDTHSVLTGAVPIETGLSKTIFDVDGFVTSPDLTGSIHNFNTITYNFGQTTGDFQNKFHSFLYPPKCKGFKCDIGKVYEGIKVGSQLAEPTFYGYSLWQSFTK